MIQAIEGLEQMYPDTCAFSNAIRLRTLRIGSDEPGYENTNLRTLALDNNIMLEYLYVQNLPNANTVLDLSNCVSLIYVDATGSAFTGYEFPDGGILETAICEKPTSLVLMNLSKLADTDDEDDVRFKINDYSRLTTLRHENTPNVSSFDIVENAANLQVVRLLNIDWDIQDTSILDLLYGMQGLNESGGTVSTSVLSGEVNIPSIKEGKLDSFNRAWPSLIISYNVLIPQFVAGFYDYDGETPILDRNGNPYVQYVDANQLPYDPILAEEVYEPERPRDERYSYVFSSWDSITTPMVSNRQIRAAYTSTPRTYTVEWYDGVPEGGGTFLKRVENIQYGLPAVYSADGSFPTYTELENYQIYYVFNGWDKSTSFVCPDPTADPSEPDTIKVHARWIVDSLPDLYNNPGLNAMNWAQRYAVAKNKLAHDYWEYGEYMDFEVGHGNDYEFDNVESHTLISTPTYFSGENDETGAPIIFNGQNGHPLIQLFNGSIDRWTLAIDFEFVGETGALFSCFNDNGSQGFEMRRTTNYANILWGDSNSNAGYKYNRNILVIRYNKDYPTILYLTSDGNILRDRYPTTSSSPETNVAHNAIVRSVFEQIQAPLTFGGVGYVDGTDVAPVRGKGWIYWAKIWYDDLGLTNCANIASTIHMPIRFKYTGIEYREDENSNELVAAGFQCDNCLEFPKSMHHQSDSTIGFFNTDTYKWLNGQFLSGLPIPLQAIINDAKVKSAINTENGYDIVSSMEKIYLPSWGECLSNVTAAHYVDELDDAKHRIPYFIIKPNSGQTNLRQTRIKWSGAFILPDDANFIVTQTDPTTPGMDYTVINEKTIWINKVDSTEGPGFIYIDADTVSKHQKYIGRALSENTDVIDAIGADSNGNTGGKWVKSIGWWSRSARIATDSRMYWALRTDGDTGTYYYSLMTELSSLSPAFSI